MQRAHRKLGVGRLDQQRELDLGGGDGADVDAALGERAECLGGHARDRVRTSLARWKSAAGTVKVRSVVAPSPDTFCTIMSTLMLASASGPKMAAATPGLSWTRRMEICASSLEKAMPVTTCCSTISSSPQISVPGGVPCGSMSSGFSKLDRTKMRTL